jgi:hypothetical protein
MITGGTSGHLMQKFRELEILDEITKLRYEGSLLDHINSNRHNVLIRQFQEWKGNNYVPSGVYANIRWDKYNLFESLNAVTDSPWNILKPNTKLNSTSQILQVLLQPRNLFLFLLLHCYRKNVRHRMKMLKKQTKDKDRGCQCI